MKFIKPILLTFFALLIGFPGTAQFKSLMKKANKEYELNAFNQAIETYRQALQERPDDPEALGNLADCYRYVNDMMEAAKHYARAVAQKKVESRHILNYAHTLKVLGRYDDAKRWYLEYAKDNPIGNHFAQTCDFAKAQQQLSTGLLVENEANINSTSSDFGPTFVQGQIVFSSARINLQQSGTQDFSGQQPNQLYVSKQGSDGKLEGPMAVGSGGQLEVNKSPIAVSPDGRLIAFTKNNYVNGTRQIPSSGMQLSLFFAEVNPNGAWVNEQPFPYNGTDFSTGYPSFSPDGNALYFASDRPGGTGGYDIYVSYRTGNTWGRPANLGPILNSQGNELSPYFDGENLFFSSDWHPGLGGFDLFRAQVVNNRVTQIFHIGQPVSSPYDDYGLIYDMANNIGYFVSNRQGGQGMEDIYSVARPAENIILTVKNAADGEPIPNSLLDFTNCGRGLVQTDDRGVYRFQAVEGMNCQVIVRKDGYIDRTIQLAATGQQGTRPMDLQLVRRGEEYYGKILNYNTRLPVEGVTVIATNQVTGNSSQTMTDRNGDYALALSPNSNYSIRYSRPGYREVSRPVSTVGTQDPTILGTISILSSDAPLPPGVTDPSQVINPYGTQTVTTPPAPSGQTASGWSIQVAALSKPGLEKFSNLNSMGEVYSTPAGNMYKIRVGVYPSEAEAKQKLNSVKAKGYPKAFVVREEGVQLSSGSAGGAQFTSNAGGGNYYIQLGAYSNPANFDGSKVASLGTVTDVPKGNLTAKVLGSYATEAAAQQVLPQVKGAGFANAYIVMRQPNGTWQRVK